jgi:hypothetical protein
MQTTHLEQADLLQELDICRRKCDLLEAQNAQLMKERAAARWQVGSDLVRSGAPNESADAGASGSSSSCVQAGDSPPPPPSPSGLPLLHHTLTACEAALKACLDDSCPTVDFDHAEEENLRKMRDIRGSAAIMAMLGITVMQKYYGALEPAMLRWVHAAAWRPREAGGLDATADSVVPAISRVYFRSLLLRLLLVGLGLIGFTCVFAVAFDGFEPGSTQEWVASAAAALVLPITLCAGASLNAKTVRELLTCFQTWFVTAHVLGFLCLLLILFRDYPAKMFAFGCTLPSFLLAGFQDAIVEEDRLLNSRAFFGLNVAGVLLYLLACWRTPTSPLINLFSSIPIVFDSKDPVAYRVALKVYIEALELVGKFSGVPLLMFGCKNLGLSFYRPGSLVVPTSVLCCLMLDADTLAVQKAAYSLQGQTLGKHKRNKTVERQLKKHNESIMEAAGALMLGSSNSVAPAPGAERANEPREGATPQPAAIFKFPPVVLVVEDIESAGDAAGGVGGVTDLARSSGAGGCAPFDMRAGPEKSPS